MKENYTEVFNYGNITPEDKRVAQEIVDICESTNNQMVAELIKHKFKLKSMPKYDIKDSVFYKKCLENEINCMIQGNILDNGIEYPVIAICEDIRILNKLF